MASTSDIVDSLIERTPLTDIVVQLKDRSLEIETLNTFLITTNGILNLNGKGLEDGDFILLVTLLTSATNKQKLHVLLLQDNRISADLRQAHMPKLMALHGLCILRVDPTELESNDAHLYVPSLVYCPEVSWPSPEAHYDISVSVIPLYSPEGVSNIVIQTGNQSASITFNVLTQDRFEPQDAITVLAIDDNIFLGDYVDALTPHFFGTARELLVVYYYDATNIDLRGINQQRSHARSIGAKGFILVNRATVSMEHSTLHRAIITLYLQSTSPFSLFDDESEFHRALLGNTLVSSHLMIEGEVYQYPLGDGKLHDNRDERQQRLDAEYARSELGSRFKSFVDAIGERLGLDESSRLAKALRGTGSMGEAMIAPSSLTRLRDRASSSSVSPVADIEDDDMAERVAEIIGSLEDQLASKKRQEDRVDSLRNQLRAVTDFQNQQLKETKRVLVEQKAYLDERDREMQLLQDELELRVNALATQEQVLAGNIKAVEDERGRLEASRVDFNQQVTMLETMRAAQATLEAEVAELGRRRETITASRNELARERDELEVRESAYLESAREKFALSIAAQQMVLRLRHKLDVSMRPLKNKKRRGKLENQQALIEQLDSELVDIMLNAAASNDVVTLRFLVTRKVSCNVQFEHGYTPLHNAVLHDAAEAVAYLLSLEEINPNLEDSAGMTPLHIGAAVCCDPDILRAIVAHPRTVKSPICHEGVPYQLAFTYVKNAGDTSLDSRAATNLKILFSAGGYDLFASAVLRSNKVWLMNNRDGLNAGQCDVSGNNLLHLSMVSVGIDEQVIRLFLAAGVSVFSENYKDESPAMLAERYGRDGFIPLLTNPSYRKISVNMLRQWARLLVDFIFLAEGENKTALAEKPILLQYLNKAVVLLRILTSASDKPDGFDHTMQLGEFIYPQLDETFDDYVVHPELVNLANLLRGLIDSVRLGEYNYSWEQIASASWNELAVQQEFIAAMKGKPLLWLEHYAKEFKLNLFGVYCETHLIQEMVLDGQLALLKELHENYQADDNYRHYLQENNVVVCIRQLLEFTGEEFVIQAAHVQRILQCLQLVIEYRGEPGGAETLELEMMMLQYDNDIVLMLRRDDRHEYLRRLSSLLYIFDKPDFTATLQVKFSFLAPADPAQSATFASEAMPSP